MLKTNKEKLVEVLLQCRPGPPRIRQGWNVNHCGEPFILPSIGGITLNVQVGDSAFGLAGDHIEPGVSCTANTSKPNEHPNTSLQLYSCAGNRARIISGETAGAEGVVIGKHGGSEHIIVDFPKRVKEKMSYDDKIIIYSKGQGLKLLNYNEIKVYNLSPELFEGMNIKVAGDGTRTLEVGVTTVIPAVCMGSGVGSAHAATGDYDIMTSDKSVLEDYKIERIRFGDIVALLDHDNRYGRAYRKGAVTIGIVVHSDCLKAGHGPGVMTLMTCEKDLIKPAIDPKSNIADIMQIGTF